VGEEKRRYIKVDKVQETESKIEGRTEKYRGKEVEESSAEKEVKKNT